MRTLGEVRLPTLRPTEVAKPANKKDFLRSMNYTWSSVLYEIPKVTRKEGARNKRYGKDSETVAQPKTPRTPKTPAATTNRLFKVRSSSDDKYYKAAAKLQKPRTPRLKTDKCRHKNGGHCQKCKPVSKNENRRITPRRTPRSTSLAGTPQATPRSSTHPLLKLPPIQRTYSISALRKHKEAATEFLYDLGKTFPRGKTPNSRSSSVQSLLAYGRNPGGPIRRSRSVSSVTEHVSRLKHSRSVQTVYGISGPNLPLHLTRSQSVNSLPSAGHRSRANSRGNVTTRSGRSRSQSVNGRSNGTKRPSAAARSRSISVVRMPSRESRGGNSRGGSRQPSRESTRSKGGGGPRAFQSRTRSVSKGKPGSSQSKKRGVSRERSLPPPPAVVVRLTKAPSAPDIYRTSSRLSVGSNDGNRKKFPLYMAIKPENQKTEKEKFFRSNFTYSPIFAYATPATESQLQKYSRASDRLLHLAVAIMNNAIRRFGTYEKYMEATGGRKLSRFEIIQACKNYLRHENMDDEVEISISEDLLSRARMSMVAGRPTVIVRAHNMREHWVEGMLRHEIGTHYIRAWNNKLQIWGSAKRRKEHHLEPANPTEEGLASLHSIIFRKDPCLWRCAMLYYTIYQATQMSFADVFNDLGRFVKDPEVRWEYCIRAKRGQADTGIPGAFCKDQVYLNGALQILKHIHDIDFHMLVRCGKVSYRDLPRLEAMGPELDRTRIPGFMVDQVMYKKELERIMMRNGLTQEHLDILP